MKFVEPSHHFTDPGAAARKLVEIANATEAVQDGRISSSWATAVSSTKAACRTSSVLASHATSPKAGYTSTNPGPM
jgi:hypothetical protein